MADAPLPGQTYACFVRSPHAFATVKSIDTKPALAIKGVVAVITMDDIKAAEVKNLSQHPPVAGRNGGKLVMPVRPALAGDKVRHVGEPVAMVLGETYAAAQDGAEAVEVEYEAHDAVTDLREAMKPGAPQVWPEAPGNIAVDWAGLARQSRRDGGEGGRGDEVRRACRQGLAGASAHQRRLDGAARRHREPRQGERQLSAARLLAGRPRHARRDGGRDGHSAGENPRHDRGGRRRVRAQDRSLSRIRRDAGRREEDRPAGALDVGPQRILRQRQPRPRRLQRRRAGARRRTASSWRSGCATTAASAPMSARSAPTSTPPT